MDPMAVIESMSSYQAEQFSEATGLPASMIVPLAVGVVVAGIAINTLAILGPSLSSM